MKRFYFALTNRCNRTCAPCCCYSRPDRSTFLSLGRFREILPTKEDFEIQLEGGEPMLHPDWKEMIAVANETGRCIKTTLGTNGSLLPFSYSGSVLDTEQSVRNLVEYFRVFPPPFTMKMSVNHYLYQQDNDLFDKAVIIKHAFELLGKDKEFELIFNVRLRTKNGTARPDAWIADKMTALGLSECSNTFYFQRYGFASNDNSLELPFIIDNPVDFYLICPEGKNWGKDLLARSEAMKKMS